MHPDRPAETLDHAPGDGRDSLRLVKIRLALTLITVAILPVAAVAPMVRAITDDSRVAQHARLGADADHTAAEMGRELEALRTSILAAGTDPAVVAAVSPKATSAQLAAAASHLSAFIDEPSHAITSVVVADPAGSVRVRAGASLLFTSAVPAIGVSAYRVVAGSATGTGTSELELVAPVSADATHATGIVGARISIDRLLAWAAPTTTVRGRSIVLRDENGHALATNGGFDATAIAGSVLDLTTELSNDSVGSSAVTATGLPTWTVSAGAPLALTAMPPTVIAALIGLIGLLVLFTLWMGRQILRPAGELEASRARLHEMYESAREAALRDSLTGLGNHRAFQEAVGRMVEASRRYAAPFALILFDIDEFKRVNDTKGHATGDELLAEVGEIIRATVREADAGYRIGGDEFAVLLPHTDTAGAETLARRLLSRSLETRSGGSYGGAISFSAGVTACPEFATSRLELTAQADAALYRGKRGGRTTVSVFDPALDRGHVDEGMRAELSSAISGVIESGALSPVYQPIVHLPTGRILGYEGLVRVDASASTFPHTGALFDAAEVAGRVLDLDRAALDVVLRGANAVPDPLLLSINVSPRSFEAPEFNATVFLAILRRHGVAPERVILELTERDAIRDPERLRTAILAVQAAGVRVAADDVGAGNAGLRLLSQFRFDVVKIDLSLVQGGAGQDQTLSVLTSLVQLASRWGALTIAEGVETAAQLRTIRRLGIDSAQGYLLGRPSPTVSPDPIDLDALAGSESPSPAPGPTTTAFPVGGFQTVPTQPRATLGVVPIARPTIPPTPPVTLGR